MGNRHLGWFRQAEADQRHAHHALNDGDYELKLKAPSNERRPSLNSVVIISIDREQIQRLVFDYALQLRQ